MTAHNTYKPRKTQNAVVADFAGDRYDARSTTLMPTPPSAPMAPAIPISAPDIRRDQSAFSAGPKPSMLCALASKIDGIILYTDPFPIPDRMNSATNPAT